MSRVAELLSDLAAEHAALDERMTPLDDDSWATPTPAEGWDVRDQVSHLCFFDEAALLAATDPDAFETHKEGLLLGAERTVDTDLGHALEPSALLGRWRRSRRACLDALAATDERARVPWYGPAMSVASFVTARLMETWAHGQDIADALGLPPVVSDRLRHVCFIGVTARPYAFLINGVDDPGDPVRVELTSPGGDVWSWGPDDAANRVEGNALEFALVVTRRRHPQDVALRVTGPVASQWIGIAQSFAGPPGPSRPAGMFR
jgi:uncharacterized protein (TIGR03084 family)